MQDACDEFRSACGAGDAARRVPSASNGSIGRSTPCGTVPDLARSGASKGQVRACQKPLRNRDRAATLGVGGYKSHRPGHMVWGIAATVSSPQGEAVAARAAGVKGTYPLSGTRPAARRLNLVPINSNLSAVAAEDRAWASKALCRTTDPDELFVRGAAQRRAAVICRHCPVLNECGAEALDNKVEYGIWGGMTERQRRALLKQHPDVVSWADFFNKRRTRSAG